MPSIEVLLIVLIVMELVTNISAISLLLMLKQHFHPHIQAYLDMGDEEWMPGPEELTEMKARYETRVTQAISRIDRIRTQLKVEEDKGFDANLDRTSALKEVLSEAELDLVDIETTGPPTLETLMADPWAMDLPPVPRGRNRKLKRALQGPRGIL